MTKDSALKREQISIGIRQITTHMMQINCNKNFMRQETISGSVFWFELILPECGWIPLSPKIAEGLETIFLESKDQFDFEQVPKNVADGEQKTSAWNRDERERNHDRVRVMEMPM